MPDHKGPLYVPATKIDARDVKRRLQDPDAFARALGLVAAGTPRKSAHTVVCPYCGLKKLSIWQGSQSVIGTCRRGCDEDGNVTYPPLDLLAKAKGWQMSGPDFQRVLELADQIARGAVPAAAAAAAAPVQPAAPQAAPPAAPKAADPDPAEEEEEDEDPGLVNLHPDRTQAEWAYVAGLGVDPYDLRGRGWLGVLPGASGASGATLWLTARDLDGECSGHCGILVSTGEWNAMDGRVLASEFGAEVLAAGPDGLSAWTASDQRDPVLHLTLGPEDFLRAEPALQRRLQPLLGLLKGVPSGLAERLPRCRRVLLHHGAPSADHLRLAQVLGAELRPISRRVAPVLSDAAQADLLAEISRPQADLREGSVGRRPAAQA